ncbi:hypothetical protein BDA96_08G152900 [Sorghum bicolor]|uniref:Uncharacterized protein n=1 Tax=Sorghum bicolor TaxID=4558 RepID=A0A921U865_SORBI|nr:hypothetical protein BDA96_08G152900 [Sorghum bicolor]
MIKKLLQMRKGLFPCDWFMSKAYFCHMVVANNTLIYHFPYVFHEFVAFYTAPLKMCTCIESYLNNTLTV